MTWRPRRSRGLPGTGTPHQFATAIRADPLHLAGTVRTKRALECANIRFAIGNRFRGALLTLSFHFQCHLFAFVRHRADRL
jgi:hypothetical protein